MWYDSVTSLLADENYTGYQKLSDTLKALSEAFTDYPTYTIPEQHQQIYRTIGGVPHLDQNYTVFGTVISGMEVVDSIAAQTVNDLDRPLVDIRILSAKVIDNP